MTSLTAVLYKGQAISSVLDKLLDFSLPVIVYDKLNEKYGSYVDYQDSIIDRITIRTDVLIVHI
jgi:hypothetical protein